jgi:uncharacterized protein (DUF1501 family)
MRRQAPTLDQALAGLINDFDERGLLESTLVLVTSEFGRTPKINATAGRDHFPRVYSVAAAGDFTGKLHVWNVQDRVLVGELTTNP